MLLLIGVPRGWLQTSTSVELVTHGWISEGPDLSALPSCIHALLPPSMLVLSVYHSRPRATNKRECHWSWDLFTALLDEEGVELEIKTLTVQ